MEVFGRIFPLFVEIKATDIGAVVSMDYTIWVNHGYDLEDKVLSELFRFLVGRQKELQNTITNIWTDTLTRMNPGSDNNIPLLNLLERVLFSNGQ